MYHFNRSEWVSCSRYSPPSTSSSANRGVIRVFVFLSPPTPTPRFVTNCVSDEYNPLFPLSVSVATLRNQTQNQIPKTNTPSSPCPRTQMPNQTTIQISLANPLRPPAVQSRCVHHAGRPDDDDNVDGDRSDRSGVADAGGVVVIGTAASRAIDKSRVLKIVRVVEGLVGSGGGGRLETSEFIRSSRARVSFRLGFYVVKGCCVASASWSFTETHIEIAWTKCTYTTHTHRTQNTHLIVSIPLVNEILCTPLSHTRIINILNRK